MKNVIYTSLIILLTAVIITDSVLAQNRSGNKNQQPYSRNYDVTTVETLEGVVMDIIYKSSKNNPEMTGVHLKVKTKDEVIPIHLGPAWYISQQEHTFSEGDQVTITGSRITFNDAPAIIAAKVQKGEMVLDLRNKNGMPNWRGWRMGNRGTNR